MSWAEQTASDRVRWTAESLGEPRTANWIAGEADVAPATARKYLEKLADDRRVKRVEDGERTLYQPDRITQHLDEVREVYEDHSTDELARTLGDIRDQIDAWQSEFEVETPNDLRATVTTVDSAAADRRREIAIEWEHLESRIDVIEDALKLYDRFPNSSRALA